MDNISKEWLEKYALAKEYYEEKGDLLIPAKYCTKNNIKLGNWICWQRKKYKNTLFEEEKRNKRIGILSEKQINLLESIKMSWDPNKDNWDNYYSLCVNYYDEFGDLLIPSSYKIKDMNLGIWLQHQRQIYKEKNLDLDKIILLEKLNINWNPKELKNDKWLFMYNLCVNYYNKYGNLYIQKRYENSDGIKLGQWLNEQRRKYKNTLKGEQRNKSKGILSEEQIDLLNKVEMIWDPIPIKGCSFFEYVIFYYLKIIYGEDKVFYRDNSLGIELDVFIPSEKIAFEYDGYPWHLEKLKNDKIKNQICIDNNILLYRFRESNLPKMCNFLNIIDIDNTNYNEIFDIIIKNLNNIFKNNLNISKKDVYEEYHNYILKYFDLKWLEKYDLCLDYYEEHKDLLMPARYEINNVKIGSWLSSQRKAYDKKDLSKEQIRLLNDINMIWDINEFLWQEMFKEAKKYYLENNNLLVHRDYETITGKKLGTWINNQRKYYKEKALSKNKIELLESIGMIWKVLESQWQENFDLAKEYYEEHGDLLIPINYKTKNGNKLGLWISSLRESYKNTLLEENKRNKKLGILSQEQIDLLNSIEMIWNSYEFLWQEMFKEAKKYYLENNNLLVHKDYETITGKKLGIWINNQRKKYKNTLVKEGKIDKKLDILSQEQIDLLNSIEMIWDVLEYQWQEMYEEAKKYYLENDNLLVSQKYITKKGFKLGNWICDQRIKYKNTFLEKNKRNNKKGILSQEQITLLENIGMVWCIK